MKNPFSESSDDIYPNVETIPYSKPGGNIAEVDIFKVDLISENLKQENLNLWQYSTFGRLKNLP